MSRLLAVNVSKPVDVDHNGHSVSTGIFKKPVDDSVMVRRTNIDGDGQADLSVHGGVDKAVYCYPHEHYAFWKQELGRAFPTGQFGENLTTEGLLEDAVRIGDRYRVGEALLEVSQPRVPCFKLGIKMGAPSIVKGFLHARRPGFYCRVIEEGLIASGDPIELAAQDPGDLSIATVYELAIFDKDNIEGVRAALRVEALAEPWKENFQERLAKLEGTST